MTTKNSIGTLFSLYLSLMTMAEQAKRSGKDWVTPTAKATEIAQLLNKAVR
jgi:hypothetical protein